MGDGWAMHEGCECERCVSVRARQRHDELAAERAAGRRDERLNVVRCLRDTAQNYKEEGYNEGARALFFAARVIERGEHEK